MFVIKGDKEGQWSLYSLSYFCFVTYYYVMSSLAYSILSMFTLADHSLRRLNDALCFIRLTSDSFFSILNNSRSSQLKTSISIEPKRVIYVYLKPCITRE